MMCSFHVARLRPGAVVPYAGGVPVDGLAPERVRGGAGGRRGVGGGRFAPERVRGGGAGASAPPLTRPGSGRGFTAERDS